MKAASSLLFVGVRFLERSDLITHTSGNLIKRVNMSSSTSTATVPEQGSTSATTVADQVPTIATTVALNLKRRRDSDSGSDSGSDSESAAGQPGAVDASVAPVAAAAAAGQPGAVDASVAPKPKRPRVTTLVVPERLFRRPVTLTQEDVLAGLDGLGENEDGKEAALAACLEGGGVVPDGTGENAVGFNATEGDRAQLMELKLAVEGAAKETRMHQEGSEEHKQALRKHAMAIEELKKFKAGMRTRAEAEQFTDHVGGQMHGKRTRKQTKVDPKVITDETDIFWLVRDAEVRDHIWSRKQAKRTDLQKLIADRYTRLANRLTKAEASRIRAFEELDVLWDITTEDQEDDLPMRFPTCYVTAAELAWKELRRMVDSSEYHLLPTVDELTDTVTPIDEKASNPDVRARYLAHISRTATPVTDGPQDVLVVDDTPAAAAAAAAAAPAPAVSVTVNVTNVTHVEAPPAAERDTDYVVSDSEMSDSDDDDLLDTRW